MLAGSRRPYHAVSEQRSRRCGVTTTGQPPLRWATVAQGSRPSYAYHSFESPSLFMWREDTFSIVFIKRLANNALMCSLACDGPTMPSASSTLKVVQSRRRATAMKGSVYSRGSRPCDSFHRVEWRSRYIGERNKTKNHEKEKQHSVILVLPSL